MSGADGFLGGRIKLRQPAHGFRSGLDAVMLAAAVPAREGEAVLELGSGAGAAALCLAARVAGCRVTGVERDAMLAALANENAAANGLVDRVKVEAADVFALPPGLKRDFAHIFVNPPFHGPGEASPDAARAAALQDEGRLTDWLREGLKRTASGGSFTAIIRADRLGEALAALPERGVIVFPLWPKPGVAAKRVILQAEKASRAPLRLAAGLVLHREDGAYTEAADSVLREGRALALA